jgi:methionyl-tRNA formyltransferase
MRIAALGRTQMLWNTIDVLHRADHEVCLIATCRAAPEYDIREKDFEQLARDIGAKFLLTQNLNAPEAIECLRQTKADLAVSVNWINIIGTDACASFRDGILNAHAGDLPRYRGNAPVAWAILQAEDRIGITIHQMDPYELDAGPILLKDYYPLSAHTYIGEVFDFLNKRVPYLFLQSIDGLESGTLMLTPQPADPNLSLRCYPRLPEDGRLDRLGVPILIFRDRVLLSGAPM